MVEIEVLDHLRALSMRLTCHVPLVEYGHMHEKILLSHASSSFLPIVPFLFHLVPLTMAHQIARVVHTDRTPAILAFPWMNGVMLAENRRDYLRDKLENSGHPKALLDMALVSVMAGLKE